MRHQELISLTSYLSNFDYGVDNPKKIWRTSVWPSYPEYDANYEAIIDTIPVQSENNYKYYNRFKCTRSTKYQDGELVDVWSCNSPENRRVIDVLEPPDRIDVDINVDLDSNNAEALIKYVRKQIVIDESGRYKYKQYKEEKISNSSLDFTSLTIGPNGHYRFYLGGTEGCEVHYLTVQISECSANACKYKIINNERVHLL